MDIFREVYTTLGCDALIVLESSNTFYLSGYASSNCQIVLTRSRNYFVTDMRYAAEASEALKGRFEVVVADGSGFVQLIGLAISESAQTVGWDDRISYREYRALQDACGKFCASFVPVADALALCRDVKQPYEIERIIKAQEITDRAFTEILKDIKEGVSEIELAAKLEYILLKEGAQLAFESIVAFGDHASTPHAHRSDRRLQKGEFVTMDFGAKYMGYCSDMTRTVALGAISDAQADVYDAVLGAQQAALDRVRAGMSGRAGDAVARDYLERRGYGTYFTHSLGHGLGIDIHEGTSMSPTCEAYLKSGMVVSVEPGVYIEGKFGVRIEDIVVIRDNDVQDLTKSNKNLIIL